MGVRQKGDLEMYDPSTARWQSADPPGFVDGWNLYEYAGGNPINLVDPLGEQAITPRMKQYGKENCKWECCPLNASFPLTETFQLELLKEIETKATALALQYTTPNTRAHHALRHCIASGLLACNISSCACAECIGTQREFAQEDDGTQPRSSTARMVNANREGLKCAGCKGKIPTETPKVYRRNPYPYPSGYGPSLNCSHIVQCCKRKLDDGILLPSPSPPYPDRNAY
jgi:hypothetical protein